jgi:hypothetical protein
MKRPKLKDMTAFEKMRWRLLQQRRMAQRALLWLKAIDLNELSYEEKDRVAKNESYWRTVIRLTKPSWVRIAPIGQLKYVIEKIAHESDI